MVSWQWLRWAILALVIVALLWFVPQLQGEHFSPKVPAEDRPALVNEYRRTWAQIIGGFGLLLGLYFTWRRIEISQKALEATRQELEATRDQQVTERFTRAIDQLGSTDDKGEKKLEIRLGGIYALERIAQDSLAMENSPGRDYSTVMEVLTAYVRENAPRTPEPSEGSSEAASTSNEATGEADEGTQQSAPPEPRRPTADIQAILDVLNRTQDRVPEEYRTRLDLREAYLQGADLQDAYLREAFLRRTDLFRAIFIKADLQEAWLSGANLQRARLRRANLRGANLRGADLQRADLQGADLQGADLRGADLRGGRGADLRGAWLQEANLRGAYLQGADLQNAYLFRADLQGAKVTDEQLADALSLEDATMPDGQKYEDWLKNKEGSGKDEENE